MNTKSPSGRRRKKGSRGLVSIGDLGYSGSTFFQTSNSKFLLKSLPRAFEQDFFKDRLLAPYAAHMATSPGSLLVRITDLLYAPMPSLGSAFGTAPSHHIVMENILYGKSACSEQRQKDWETYDLKPADYFFPERDIADGALAPESVKDRLIDTFPDKLRLTVDEKESLTQALLQDTKLLADANAVDYSLFLIRYPYDPSSSVPSPPGISTPWRTGVVSGDKKWVYRIVLLDFFWARDSLQAKAMDGLISSWNFLQWGKGHGPMSVTTSAGEYRERFLRMVGELVEVEG